MPSSRPVRIDKARRLLRTGVPGPGGVWADLGCGDGIFSAALYPLIQPGGVLYAVDRSRRALRALERALARELPGAELRPLRADFTRPLALPPLDGLLMANSLHFVRQKEPLLARLSGLLKPGGRLIVVEYNTRQGNPWVPYPLDASGFLQLARAAGLRQARILTTIPSTFLGEMYSGLALGAQLPEG